MINDHGMPRYKEPNFDRASFPDMILFEAGVHYMRDYQYRVHAGFMFFEYRCKKDNHIWLDHVYIRMNGSIQTAKEDFRKLLDLWSRAGYSYTVATTGLPDEAIKQTPPPPKEKKMPNAHKPELDNMSPAQIRVLCEELLYTMDTEQRRKIMGRLPGIYHMAYPGSAPVLKT